MLTFGVCDDQPYVCQKAEEHIKDFMKTTGLEYEVHTFTGGKSLLNTNKKIDILFLDIEMPKIDGFQVAEKLNQKNDELIIIFLTGYTERFQRAFKVNAFRYLIKPISLMEFNEALSDAINLIYSQKRILVDDENRSVLISDSKIQFVESIGDRTVIYTKSEGRLMSVKTLKHWANVLEPAKFIQTHKSFIVSFEHIRSLGKTSIYMADGTEVPVSTRNVRSVKAGLDGYIKRMTRGTDLCLRD